MLKHRNLLIIHMTGAQSKAARKKYDNMLKKVLKIDEIISTLTATGPEPDFKSDMIDKILAPFDKADIALGLMDDQNIEKVKKADLFKSSIISAKEGKTIGSLIIYHVYIDDKKAIEYETKYKNFFKKEIKAEYFKIV